MNYWVVRYNNTVLKRMDFRAFSPSCCCQDDATPLYFHQKSDAKIMRDWLNEEKVRKSHWVVSPGPDHWKNSRRY